MTSTFSGYSIAGSGLRVNQTVLATISHNLANVGTSGYSRQKVGTAEMIVKQSGGKISGSGISVESVVRTRNTFLDQTYRTENAALSYYESKNSNITSAENLLSDFQAITSSSSVEETGIQSTLQSFFDSWDELSKDPSSTTARKSVLEAANTFIDILAETDKQLQQMQQDSVNSVKDGVNNINNLASQAAKLNAKISKAEASGAEANDLRDQRDELVDKISKLADVETNEQTNGTYEISIGGVDLVQGDQSRALVASGEGMTNNPLTVTWQGLGTKVELSSGSILAQMEDADQNMETTLTTTTNYTFRSDSGSSIGVIRQGLNTLVTTIANEINTLHAAAYDLNGDITNIPLFTNGSTGDGTGISISNIQINPKLDDANLLSVSKTGNLGDGTVASEISSLQSESDLSFDGLSKTPNEFYSSLISWLGTEGKTIDGLVTTQDSLVTQVDTQRQSVSGVSLDEELTKMISNQSAYAACAKYLSTIDSLLAGLIQQIQ